MPLSAVNPNQYAALLQSKVAKVCERIAAHTQLTPEQYPSSPLAYRMRAEFRLWHSDNDIHYAMFRPENPKEPVFIEEFPIACTRIQQLMPELLKQISACPPLRERLFQVEFLSSLTGDTVVTLIYRRPLNELWEQRAQALAQSLKVSIVGRSRKQKCVIGRDYVNETLEIETKSYRYRQYEQAFSQPNALVNCKMIEWACRQAKSLSGDLLELYCGNGNFSLPLAAHFQQLIATEMAKSSIKAARENMQANAINNIEIVRLSAQEVSQAIGKVREFRRLAELNKPLHDYQLNTVFVDPPRAGLDPETLNTVGQFKTIIYISCNPASLIENLASLCSSHEVTAFATFDQFPYTDHLECGVVLQKR